MKLSGFCILERSLASGGNDNKLYVWQPQLLGNKQDNDPVCRFNDHTAAVKAVAWSPHSHGLLASGGLVLASARLFYSDNVFHFIAYKYSFL
jgi:WD40 repeat protein